MAVIVINSSACGGSYFDNGSRALKLHTFIRQADVEKAKNLLETCESVSTEMRFKFEGEHYYTSAVGAALELGWRAG